MCEDMARIRKSENRVQWWAVVNRIRYVAWDFITGVEFIDHLTDCQRLKKECAQLILFFENKSSLVGV
jgi:2-polyprenyl-3-methyl-5-hydroxy-6-metoxy-1,4-benzoquinol methylase